MSGQLGIDPISNLPLTSPTLIPYFQDIDFRLIPNPGTITFITCGQKHSAVIAGGNLYMFGRNEYGQLGISDRFGHAVPRPTLISSLEKVTHVACGYVHTMAVSNGKLYAVGNGEQGKLGLGDFDNQRTFTLVPKLNDKIDYKITSVACGQNFTAAVSDEGKLYTFGGNGYGQLGHGTLEIGGGYDPAYIPRSIPSLVSNLTNATQVSCGEAHTAVVSNDKLYTFGSGLSGELGFGSGVNRPTPTLVSDLSNVTMVACGASYTAVIGSRCV